MMNIIQKHLPTELITDVLEYYNPYKEYYKTRVLPDIERITLGAWYIYDVRDTVRNYIQREGIILDYLTCIGGVLYGEKITPSQYNYMWEDRFIQGNPYKTL